MNYLAHAYLSFQTPGVLTGNMISDFVKGRAQYSYDATIQKGIRLHRFIDAYTDDHAATRTVKQLLKPFVGAYAGAFMDVIYDHFLAIDPSELTEHEWAGFSEWVYQELDKDVAIMPARFAQMLPYMRSQNWLFNYRHTWGIEKSFEGVVRRARYLEQSEPAFRIFLQEYDHFSAAYHSFFPDVKKAARAFFDEQ